MTYYLDSDFMLHLQNDGTMKPWEDTDGFFDGKAQVFIEGHRVVPEGEKWERADGQVFTGLMISPAKNYTELQLAQMAEEAEDMKNALKLLGVTVNA